MDTKYVERLLADNIEYVKNNNFDALYNLCGYTHVKELTYFLIQCDVYPLKYMTFVPDNFSYGLPITDDNIHGSMNYIGKDAYAECDAVKEIILPRSVQEVGVGAFSKCFNLKKFVCNDTIESIRANTFFKCTGLTDIVIGKNVKSIGNSAFSNCDSLTKINIPEGVESIYNFAFWECTSLEEVFLPSTLQKMTTYIFHMCPLKKVTYNGTVEQLKHLLDESESSALPDGITINCTDGDYKI